MGTTSAASLASVQELAKSSAPHSTPEAQVVRAELPKELVLGVPLETGIPGDRNLRVAHAAAPNDQAIVYLHGMCGNPRGSDDWVDLATARGTLVVVRGNVKCPDRPGYKWPQDISAIHRRIQSALEFVQQTRNGLLQVQTVTLIGYSQGAHRAERLAEAYPDSYPRVVLGGPPTSPDASRLARTQRIAVLGGELENTDYMRRGSAALCDAGLSARFFLLPGAHHGSYGPQGHELMQQVLAWVFE